MGTFAVMDGFWFTSRIIIDINVNSAVSLSVVLAGQRSRRQRPSWRRGQLSKLSRQAGGLQDVGKFLQQEDAPPVRMGKSKINGVLAFGPPWSYCAAGCAE